MSDKVWIEFEKTSDLAHGKEICAKANRMLERLNDGPAVHQFDCYQRDGSLLISFTFGNEMGYIDLPDRGHWLNLDYLGRE